MKRQGVVKEETLKNKTMDREEEKGNNEKWRDVREKASPKRMGFQCGYASWLRLCVHMVFEPFSFTLSGVLWENAQGGLE